VPKVPSLRDLVNGFLGNDRGASWRDHIKPAKFRDVEFYVASSDRAGGRRQVKHEYPQRQKPSPEDMGRKARTFQIDGYVIGEDYFEARDKLIDALESDRGPGTLNHPYHGKVRVAVDDYRVRETNQAGGIAEFSITFIEAPPDALAPVAVTDGPSLLLASASAARAASLGAFLKQYSPGSLLSSVSAAVRSVTRSIDLVTDTVTMEVQNLATLKSRITDLQSSVNTLVKTPENLAGSLSNMFDSLASRTGLKSIYDYDPGNTPPSTTPNRIQEQTNFNALNRFVQQTIAIRSAELLASDTFDSYESAVSARNSVSDMLDEQAELSTDEAYPVLLQLRADMVKAVPGDSGELKRLVAYTPTVTVPSLVLAYNLYGDLSRESDLLARNSVRHPGFMVGGVELEVLSSD
jgi:prophage DNA circulation protein